MPLVGARRRERLTRRSARSSCELDLDRIEAAIPDGAAAGDRYPAAQMAHLPA